MRNASCRRSVGYGQNLQATSHRLRAKGYKPRAARYMPPLSIPRTRPANTAEIRVHAGSNAEDWVAVNGPTAGHELQAIRLPCLPQGKGALLDAKRELQALGWLRTKSTSHELQATGHRFLFCLPHQGRWPKAGGGVVE